MNGIKKRGVCEVTKNPIPQEKQDNMVIITEKLFLAVKELGEPEERKKPRMVTQSVSSKDWAYS